MIFESIFSYPASSRTDLTAEPAFIPVPIDAGISLTTADLNFLTTGYGTVFHAATGTTKTFLYAS